MKSRSWFGVCVLLGGCRAYQQPFNERVFMVEAPVTQAAAASTSTWQPQEYHSAALRSPFALPGDRQSFASALPMATPCANADVQLAAPDALGFPLEQLRLKGVIGHGQQQSALIAAPSGQIRLVTIGDKLGTQAGTVLRVTADSVEIQPQCQMTTIHLTFAAHEEKQ